MLVELETELPHPNVALFLEWPHSVIWNSGYLNDVILRCTLTSDDGKDCKSLV